MFDIAPSELMIVVFVAIVLIGPKDLPRVMRMVGNWVGKGRAMMRHFHGAVDEMMRQAELQEAQAKQAKDAPAESVEKVAPLTLVASLPAPTPAPQSTMPERMAG